MFVCDFNQTDSAFVSNNCCACDDDGPSDDDVEFRGDVCGSHVLGANEMRYANANVPGGDRVCDVVHGDAYDVAGGRDGHDVCDDVYCDVDACDDVFR